ncbi:MAG: DNA helicase PcrA [Lachnospiraceae bacterium]|nr:DNA helicase PcrA [Lachnospiraceae bacterium]
MSFIESLNNKQQEAVLHTEGPLLILAGAGSGKTRVITNRIGYLIHEKGVNPRDILAITFTNKAASEMRERVEAQLGMDAGGAWICTFHSACVRILRMYSHILGYDNNFTIYDTDDQKTVVKNICKKLDIDTKRFKEKWFLSQISSAKDELIGPDKFALDASGDYYLEKVAKVYDEYQKELKKNNAFDFDDLIVKTVELFRAEPEILERFQERFRYISVDEYQDTNTAQFKLASLLAGKYRNICVVGDDDQSIYKFRGANIENILNFEKEFPGAKVIRLEQNYRSTKTILEAANAVIKNNTQRKEKKLWTENEDGAPIRLFHVDNAYVESDKVVSQIRSFLKEGYSLNDCACLYRTNAQSRALEEAFIRENIPYRIVGGVNFYQRKEIKDILAYLKTVDNGRDDVSVRRIINVPKRGIGAACVNLVQALADERRINFYSALSAGVDEELFGRNGEKLSSFRTLIDYLAVSAQDMTIVDLIKELLDRTGYMRELEAEDTVESETRIENINELINKAALYEENSDDPSLSGFLEEVSLVADIDMWNAEDDYVSLITIHSAKGLEFPIVFLCGMEDGLFPMNAAICSDDPSDLEEERRLAYVAITRAKKLLILTAARSRMVRGETMVSILSRFVKEIPQTLIEYDRENVYIPKNQSTVRPGRDSVAGFKAKPYGGTYTHTAVGGESRSSGSFLSSKPYSQAPAKQFQVNAQAGSLEYEVGDRVSHIKFGEGTVIQIDQGGRDFEVTVDFEDFGVKKMFASFAKLKKVY